MLRTVISDILGKLRFLCSRPTLITILTPFLCNTCSSLICCNALILERRHLIPTLCLSRQLAKLLVTPPARAAISVCLPSVIWVPTLVSRLLTRFPIGCMLTPGLSRLAGWTTRLIILLDKFNLQLLGAVDRHMARLMCRRNLGYPSGWPLTVEGRWNLRLINACPWEVLFLHTVLTRGMAIRDLLTISRKLLGKKLSSARGGALVVWLLRRCEQPLIFEYMFIRASTLRLQAACTLRCRVLSLPFRPCSLDNCLLSLLWTAPSVCLTCLGLVIQREVGKTRIRGLRVTILLASGRRAETWLTLLLKNLTWTVSLLHMGTTLIALFCMWNALWAKVTLPCPHRTVMNWCSRLL